MKSWMSVCLVSTTLFAIEAPPLPDLIQEALAAREMAYCPYSGYLVGSALVGKSGKVYRGCNVENASYGLAQCSERTAVFKAVSEGEREFSMIVIATRDGGVSCGGCRQVMNEFSPNMRIVAVNSDGEVCCDTTLDQLLPQSFGPHNLQD